MRVAAALLRVAESLDRSHAAVVSQVEFRGRGDGAVLLIRGEGETELELWATRRQKSARLRRYCGPGST